MISANFIPKKKVKKVPCRSLLAYVADIHTFGKAKTRLTTILKLVHTYFLNS